MLEAESRLMNFGHRQRKARFLLGLVSLGASVAVAVSTVGAGGGLWWQLAFFVLLASAVTLFIEARTGRCPATAELGERDLEALISVGGEKIEDQGLVREIRSHARKEAALALVISVVLAAAFLIIF